MRPVNEGERDLLDWLTQFLFPPGAVGNETQSEGIMLSQQRVDHLLQLLGVDGLPGLQHPGHIPMAGLLELMIQKPMLNGRERERPGHDSLISRHRLEGFRRFGQPGYRLVLEDMSWRDPQPGLTGLGHDLNAEDGIAAQLEEVIAPAHPIDAQHLSPDLGQGLLDRPPGSLISRIELRPHTLRRRQGRRSTLPLGVRGKASSITKCAGTI